MLVSPALLADLHRILDTRSSFCCCCDIRNTYIDINTCGSPRRLLWIHYFGNSPVRARQLEDS